MTEKKLQLAGALALLLGISIGCALDDNGYPIDGSIVFPGEAYLGGTVALVLAANYAPIFELDHYDLHAGNVEVRVFYGEGQNDYETVLPRTVFDVNLSPSSRAALNAPGAYSTIVVFDLPTALGEHFTEYPQSDVRINVNQIGGGGGSFGFVNVLGEQAPGFGEQTFLGLGFDSDPTSWGNDGMRPIEEGLLPQTMVRLRAVHDDAIPAAKKPGFGAVRGQQIGAIEFWVMYYRYCMENLRAYPNSEAAGATVILGPPGYTPYWGFQKVVLVDPNGFTLDKPTGSAAPLNAAGEGPFLDLAFDWNP